jgi:hypothetical protein
MFLFLELAWITTVIRGMTPYSGTIIDKPMPESRFSIHFNW